MSLPPGVVHGKCCVCEEPNALVAYCSLCGSWICGQCRHKYKSRAAAAWKKLIRQGVKCGPVQA